MATHFSPRDPLFYLHHGYIDMQWAMAQREWSKFGLDQCTGLDQEGHQSSCMTNIQGYEEYTYESIVSIEKLCYSYDALENTVILIPDPNPVPETTESVTTTDTSASSENTETLSDSADPIWPVRPVPLKVLEQQLKITQIIKKIPMNGQIKKRHLTAGYRNDGQEIIDNNRIPVTSDSVVDLECPPPPPEDWLKMNFGNNAEANNIKCEDIKEKMKDFGVAPVVRIKLE